MKGHYYLLALTLVFLFDSIQSTHSLQVHDKNVYSTQSSKIILHRQKRTVGTIFGMFRNLMSRMFGGFSGGKKRPPSGGGYGAPPKPQQGYGPPQGGFGGRPQGGYGPPRIPQPQRPSYNNQQNNIPSQQFAPQQVIGNTGAGDSYGSPAAPIIGGSGAGDSYGAPQAAVIGGSGVGDSYGAPQAAVIGGSGAGDSYGSPVSQPVSAGNNYGSPQVSVISDPPPAIPVNNNYGSSIQQPSINNIQSVPQTSVNNYNSGNDNNFVQQGNSNTVVQNNLGDSVFTMLPAPNLVTSAPALNNNFQNSVSNSYQASNNVQGSIISNSQPINSISSSNNYNSNGNVVSSSSFNSNNNFSPSSSFNSQPVNSGSSNFQPSPQIDTNSNPFISNTASNVISAGTNSNNFQSTGTTGNSFSSNNNNNNNIQLNSIPNSNSFSSNNDLQSNSIQNPNSFSGNNDVQSNTIQNPNSFSTNNDVQSNTIQNSNSFSSNNDVESNSISNPNFYSNNNDVQSNTIQNSNSFSGNNDVQSNTIQNSNFNNPISLNLNSNTPPATNAPVTSYGSPLANPISNPVTNQVINDPVTNSPPIQTQPEAIAPPTGYGIPLADPITLPPVSQATQAPTGYGVPEAAPISDIDIPQGGNSVNVPEGEIVSLEIEDDDEDPLFNNLRDIEITSTVAPTITTSRSAIQVDLLNGSNDIDLTNGLSNEENESDVDLTGSTPSDSTTSAPLFPEYYDNPEDYDPTAYDDYDYKENDKFPNSIPDSLDTYGNNLNNDVRENKKDGEKVGYDEESEDQDVNKGFISVPLEVEEINGIRSDGGTTAEASPGDPTVILAGTDPEESQQIPNYANSVKPQTLYGAPPPSNTRSGRDKELEDQLLLSLPPNDRQNKRRSKKATTEKPPTTIKTRYYRARDWSNKIKGRRNYRIWRQFHLD